MKVYDYNSNMFYDILEVINEEYSTEEVEEKLKENRFNFEEELHDKLWTYDNVTGNGSGSYTFCSQRAKENLYGNEETLVEALIEFGYEDLNILKKGPEWLDVAIRCYLLRSIICEVLDYLEEELCIMK